MEGNLNIKNLKPTLSNPTKKGAQVDSYFKKQMRPTGMALKETYVLNEKEQSLKKKIFKLDKMETLVHTDEYLSKVFAELKQDADELYGYHWNETILNMIFNDYVLNSPKYLDKYKNTRAKQKTRRGEEGIAQLQNDINKEKEVTTGAEERKQDLLKKDAEAKDDDKDKQELDEFFGLIGKNIDSNIPFEKRSKNDTYFVDVKRNKLLEPVPYNAPLEQKREIITKYAGKPDIKQISWFDAVSRGIKGVPKEVPDGSYEQIKQEMEAKYKAQGGISAIPALEETDGAANSGAYATALDSHNPKEIADKTYQNETTTSASSGQYSTASAWSKTGKPAANKPAWKGGQVIGESVINGDLSYLTDAAPFKKYIILNQINELLYESYDIEEGETFKQTAERIYKKIQQYGQENPELSNTDGYKETLDIAKYEAETGKAHPSRTGGSSTVPTQKVTEHHLSTKEDKVEFILKNTYDDATDSARYNIQQLNAMSDEDVDALYRSIEKEKGISEQPDFDEMLKKDLKYTGNDVHDGESREELEANDGLFKGKWNENKPLDENAANLSVDKLLKWAASNVLYATSDPSPEIQKFVSDNGINVQTLKDKAKFYAANAAIFGNAAEVKDVMLDLIAAIDEMNGLNEEKGLWDNIRAKRERGEKPLKKGQEGYPDKKQWDMLTKEEKETVNEKAVSKKQQKFMGMVHAAQKGELKNPSPEVEKAAETMSDKDAKDFASTKHKGLPEKKKKKVDEDSSWEADEDLRQLANHSNASRNSSLVQNTAKELSDNSNDVDDMLSKLQVILDKYNIKDSEDISNIIDIAATMKKNTNEGIFDFGKSSNELNVDQIVSAIENFNNSQDSPEFRNQFVKAKDYVKNKAGNVARMPQLKMWLDKNMPQLSNYVGTLWGNWELMPANNKLSENKNMMNKNGYKSVVKAMLESTGKSFKLMNETEKKSLFENADFFYKAKMNESMIDDQPDSMINNQESSMAKSMDSDELNKDGQPVAAASAVGGVQEGSYDTDDVKAKGSLLDKFADYSDEESEDDNSAPVVAPSSANAPESGVKQYQMGWDDSQVAKDASAFRDMLKAKYGVDSVSDLSFQERQELMKSMNFGGKEKSDKPEMDFSQFQTTDDEKAAFADRDTKRLSFLAQNADAVNSVQDFQNLAKEFKNQSGENMHHPMAILASIQALPAGSELRNKLGKIETILKSNMKESVNEERKTSAILNVEKLGKENAKNFDSDMAKEDAISQDKTYPYKKDGIYTEKVWPDPSKFYIEQDLEKVQKDAKSMADLEKEALAKTKGNALQNVGNSANEKGNEITKRNLSKEEMLAVAMNRGDGMQDIVYDNKPSEKFEKRMEKDMGKEIYELRQDKMDYKADAPMYNKDTQPTASGDKKEENNKFKVGYNNESLTAKYRDEFNKVKLVEFKVGDVTIVDSINEGSFKLSLDGMGNRYSLVGKKINENVGFENIVNDYNFYLNENAIFAIEKSKDVIVVKEEKKINESFDKMKHLMKYNPSNYVDTKKSVKF